MNNTSIILYTTVAELKKAKEGNEKFKAWLKKYAPDEAHFQLSITTHLCDIQYDEEHFIFVNNIQNLIYIHLKVNHEDILVMRKNKDKSIVGYIESERTPVQATYEVTVPLSVCHIGGIDDKLVGFNASYTGVNEEDIQNIKAIIIAYISSNRSPSIHSYHEGYAKILERLDNMWESIRKNDELNIQQSLQEIIATSLKVLDDVK